MAKRATKPTKPRRLTSVKTQALWDLLAVGLEMSNICFNWSQSDRFTARERWTMKNLQERFDVARDGLLDGLRRKRKTP
jgi:hypothetical protein